MCCLEVHGGSGETRGECGIGWKASGWEGRWVNVRWKWELAESEGTEKGTGDHTTFKGSWRLVWKRGHRGRQEERDGDVHGVSSC